MTVLTGDIKDVGLRPTKGWVVVSSASTRKARGTTGIITRELHRYELEGGKFKTADLDPGRLVVELSAEGVYERWVFDLPDSKEPVSLASMLGNVEEYSPAAVSVVQAAVEAAHKASLEAGASAEEAAAAALRAAEAASNASSGVPGDGWPLSSLSAEVRDAIASGGKATVEPATADSLGTVQLAGDLGGTADAPTVNAVQSVTPSVIVRRDASAQIFVPSTQDNNNHALSKGYADGRYMQKSAVSQDPGAYTLAQRVSTGALKVGEPTASTHAATKNYVDTAIDALQKRITALESAVQTLQQQAVTSTVVRTIAKGTGSNSTTLYIEGV